MFEGSTFRSAAKRLFYSELAKSHPPFIRPVVVIWGEFEQDRCEEKGVFYVAGGSLKTLLAEIAAKPKLSEARIAELATAVEALH